MHIRTPHPGFRYNAATGLITVEFECDPAFAGGTNWRAKTFYVAGVRCRRPRSILDGASDALPSAFRNPFSLLPITLVPASGSDRR